MQLSRELGVQYKTAWVLALKIREALGYRRVGMKLEGTVQMDVSAHFHARGRGPFDRDRCQMVASDQAAAALVKLKGSRSLMSASVARCGNSVRTWRK